ncbi:uncharacterized protein LOC115626580 [Scaptodrosophila lebanonensis]|uniref:Uncharacterized protein LOC115626580 n=1 Tax=Drosophila lebanonensis TaxID=7225 RepID=A0A6J2TML0_DROLE|nr:uncharacterized protein LOC115626580 [Scaptodrosophila lebanonensis]
MSENVKCAEKKEISKKKGFMCMKNEDGAGRSPNQLESLHDISSLSSETELEDPKLKQVDTHGLERVVRKALEQFKAAATFDDIDALMSVLMPKIILDLHPIEQLEQQVLDTKQTLKSYMQNANALDQDIADIFLDLHNIYIKLERLDSRKRSKQQAEKLRKRVKEAEELQKNFKHYITNERPPQKSEAKDEPESTLAPTKDNELIRSSGGPMLAEFMRRLTMSESNPKPKDMAAVQMEKHAFLTNLVTLKKSECTLDLNRFKTYNDDAMNGTEQSPKDPDNSEE